MNMTLLPDGKDIAHAPAPPMGVSETDVFITAGHDWRSRAVLMTLDLRRTATLWRLVWALSVMDIRLRYRGSLLGPFWLTLSTAVMVGSLGFLYSRLFHTNIVTYLPFLSLSLVLWNFLSTLVTEGCTCFTTSEGMIRAMRMPLSLHAARVVVRNILVFAHNIVVIVVVFLIMRTVPGHMSFLLVPAFALWLIDAFAICLALGVLCTRYRDVPPIVASILQIAFFVSPILWSPTILAHRASGIVLVNWNPFFALMDIVRAPLLGTEMTWHIWGVALVYSALLVASAGFIFMRARARLAYWV
jgi:lipopolysaccharide transport system permease protein